MTALQVLPLMFLLIDADGPGWEEAAKDEGVTVYSRAKAGGDVKEMKAIGLIDAPPDKVWKAVRDYEHYDTTMPYTEQSKVLSKENDGKTIFFYSVVNAPLVSRRDYVIKLSDESDWKDGKGYLKVTWTTVGDKGPPVREDVVRVKINDGFWKLEPRDKGTKTFATYYVYTDPGGSLPKWVVNKANGTAVPNVFRSVRTAVAKP